MEPDKKISFAFSKSSKKPVVINIKPVEKEKELIDCLEGQSIKVKNAIVIVKEPLVIPIKDNKRNLLDRVRESRAKADKTKENGQTDDTRPDSELTIDELAARELLNDAKKHLAGKETSNAKIHVLPLNAENMILDGEKEPTLEDYENVPISDYGLAMLRGMGWKEGSGIGKTATKIMSVVAPQLRPKGLGLGASKLVQSETPSKPACDKDGQMLTLKKGAHAKIIAGKHKGTYCEVQGLDDEGGRIIVKTSLKCEILTLNESVVIPVTKEEYSRGSKILNSVKYEDFKTKENKMVKEEIYEDKSSKYKSSRDVSKEDLDSSRHKSKDKHYELKGTKESGSKSRHKDCTSSSSDSELERTRKQHKRKDKRRHRDKSRSPYREKTGSHKKSSKTRHRYVSPSKNDTRPKYSRSKDRTSSSSSDSYKDCGKNKR